MKALQRRAPLGLHACRGALAVVLISMLQLGALAQQNVGAQCPVPLPITGPYIMPQNQGKTFRPSSTFTVAPFSRPPVRLEDLAPHVKTPLVDLTCDKRNRCFKAFVIEAKNILADFGFKSPVDGSPLRTDMIAYDGTIPGPQIRVQRGVQTLVRVINNINCNISTGQPLPPNIRPAPTAWIDRMTMHLHGSPSLAPFDGWAEDYIGTCGYKDYIYPNVEYAPVWYHDHSLDKTFAMVGLGLYGPYIVDSCDALLADEDRKPTSVRIPLMLSDLIFAYNNETSRMDMAMSFAQNLGDHNLVNGNPWPVVTVEPRPYRIVFYNSAARRVFNLTLVNSKNESLMQDKRFYVVGGDVGWNEHVTTAPYGLMMAPGERYEVVLDFSHLELGSELTLMNLNSSWTEATGVNPMWCFSHLVMKFVVSRPSEVPQEPLGAWVDRADNIMEPETGLSATEAREWCAKYQDAPQRSIVTVRPPGPPFNGTQWALAAKDGSWTVNMEHGMYLPISAPTDGVEVWEFANPGGGLHPMHMHLVNFFVCKRTGGPAGVPPRGIEPFEVGMAKDVLTVGPNESVVFVARFGPHQGSYQVHCHDLLHEDTGLMAAFNSTSPLRPLITVPAGSFLPNVSSSLTPAAFKTAPLSPKLFAGKDPLVGKVNSTVGSNLYYAEALPPADYEYEKDGEFQKLNKKLLTEVLARQYYKLYYPKRANLNTTVKANPWAVTCQDCPGCPVDHVTPVKKSSLLKRLLMGA